KLFATRDVQHDSSAQNTIPRDRNRDRVLGVAVQKICGSIERISDDHDPFAGDRSWRELLAEHDCFGQAALDDADDLSLRSFIDLADEIRPSLGFPNEPFALGGRSANYFSAAACSLERNRQQIVVRTLACLNCLQLLSLAL